MGGEGTGKDAGVSLKRTAKDTVFTSLFWDKEYVLELYRALHPEDMESEEKDLRIITLENIMAGGIYNDLGFELNEKLIFLIEAQATWTMNILVRMLMYLAKSYQDFIIRKEQNVYGSKKVVLPKAELYVIYTGSRKAGPETISFAEEFFPGQECCMDIKIKMIYDGQKGDIISQYVTFAKVFDEQVRRYGLCKRAVRETIRICRDRNVLRKYLESRESEVVDIMITLFSQEEVWDMQVRSREKEASIKTMIEEGKYYGASEQEIAERLKERFNISQDDADRTVKEYY